MKTQNSPCVLPRYLWWCCVVFLWPRHGHLWYRFLPRPLRCLWCLDGPEEINQRQVTKYNTPKTLKTFPTNKQLSIFYKLQQKKTGIDHYPFICSQTRVATVTTYTSLLLPWMQSEPRGSHATPGRVLPEVGTCHSPLLLSPQNSWCEGSWSPACLKRRQKRAPLSLCRPFSHSSHCFWSYSDLYWLLYVIQCLWNKS